MAKKISLDRMKAWVFLPFKPQEETAHVPYMVWWLSVRTLAQTVAMGIQTLHTNTFTTVFERKHVGLTHDSI